jgi:hypothetical protein
MVARYGNFHTYHLDDDCPFPDEGDDPYVTKALEQSNTTSKFTF